MAKKNTKPNQKPPTGPSAKTDPGPPAKKKGKCKDCMSFVLQSLAKSGKGFCKLKNEKKNAGDSCGDFKSFRE